MNSSSKTSLQLARLSCAAALMLAANAHAGNSLCNSGGNAASCTLPAVTSGNSVRHTTQAFAGVNWTFGVGPDLVAGVRYTRTDSRQRITGARLEAVFPFAKGISQISFDRLRLRLIGGNRSGMYELGGGYSFSGQGFLASAALQGEHITLGTDLIFGGMQWLPYVGFNTLTKPKVAAGGGGATCPSGFSLSDVATLQAQPAFTNVNAADQLNGQTCFKPGQAPVLGQLQGG